LADILSSKVGNGQTAESKRISLKEESLVNRIGSALERNVRIGVYGMVM